MTKLITNNNLSHFSVANFRSFSAIQSKHIRVGVNSFFEALILCTETLQEFGPPADCYDYK